MEDRAIAAAARAELEGTPGLVSAYLFGSTADGRAHRESDVDLAVLLDWAVYPAAANRFDTRLRLIARLQGAIGREVDLIVLNDAPPQLGRHIMSNGRRLLVTNADLDHAHRRLTMSRAADLEPFLRRMRALKLEAIGE
jgi:uncharacterized protein